MNFVGHAFVAGRLRSDSAFVFGAMLPDFATMCGARLLEPALPALREGIAEHHRSDERFHQSTVFHRWCRTTTEALDHNGFGRGAARAVAHVGCELLLDGELLLDPVVEETYARCLEESPAFVMHVRFEHKGAERFQGLHERLRAYGTPHVYREVLFVRERLVEILAKRPTLALREDEAARLLPFLEALQSQVREERALLLEELGISPVR